MRVLRPVLLSRLSLLGLMSLMGLVRLGLMGLLGVLVGVEERRVVRASCGRRLWGSARHRPSRGNKRLGIASWVLRLLGRVRLMMRSRVRVLVLLALVLVPGLLVIEGEIPRRGLMMRDGDLRPSWRRVRGV